MRRARRRSWRSARPGSPGAKSGLSMPSTDTVFAGSIPATYDRYLLQMFAPHAEQIAARLRDLERGALLETAAGTGIVTAILARTLPPAVAITATDLNQPMLDF